MKHSPDQSASVAAGPPVEDPQQVEETVVPVASKASSKTSKLNALDSLLLPKAKTLPPAPAVVEAAGAAAPEAPEEEEELVVEAEASAELLETSSAEF